MSEVKANTCPYCGAPYGVVHGGCRDDCAAMRARQLLIAAALDAGIAETDE